MILSHISDFKHPSAAKQPDPNRVFAITPSPLVHESASTKGGEFTRFWHRPAEEGGVGTPKFFALRAKEILCKMLKYPQKFFSRSARRGGEFVKFRDFPGSAPEKGGEFVKGGSLL